MYGIMMGTKGKVWVSDNPEQDATAIELNDLNDRFWRMRDEMTYTRELVNELTLDIKALVDCNIIQNSEIQAQNQKIRQLEGMLRHKIALKELIP